MASLCAVAVNVVHSYYMIYCQKEGCNRHDMFPCENKKHVQRYSLYLSFQYENFCKHQPATQIF